MTQVSEEREGTLEQPFLFGPWQDDRQSPCSHQRLLVEKTSICGPWRSPRWSRGLLSKKAVTLRESCAGVFSLWENCCPWKTPALAGGVRGGLSPVGGMPRCLRKGLWGVFLLKRKSSTKNMERTGTNCGTHPLAAPAPCGGGGDSKAGPGKGGRGEGKMYEYPVFFSLSCSDLIGDLEVVLLLKFNWFCFPCVLPCDHNGWSEPSVSFVLTLSLSLVFYPFWSGRVAVVRLVPSLV